MVNTHRKQFGHDFQSHRLAAVSDYGSRVIAIAPYSMNRNEFESHIKLDSWRSELTIDGVNVFVDIVRMFNAPIELEGVLRRLRIDENGWLDIPVMPESLRTKWEDMGGRWQRLTINNPCEQVTYTMMPYPLDPRMYGSAIWRPVRPNQWNYSHEYWDELKVSEPFTCGECERIKILGAGV